MSKVLVQLVLIIAIFVGICLYVRIKVYNVPERKLIKLSFFTKTIIINVISLLSIIIVLFRLAKSISEDMQFIVTVFTLIVFPLIVICSSVNYIINNSLQYGKSLIISGSYAFFGFIVTISAMNYVDLRGEEQLALLWLLANFILAFICTVIVNGIICRWQRPRNQSVHPD